MAFRPPPSNLACSPHVRPSLRLSFTLVPDAMGCAGPVSMQPAPGTARATWSRSLDRQHARGARTRGPARKGGRRRQVRGVSTAARRHVRQPEALIDQLMESPSDGHKADGLVPSYFHEFIPCHEIALEHTHWLLHVLHAIPVIFSDFIHREINVLEKLSLDGVVTHQPASCQHSYIGGGCPSSRSSTVGGEACVYVCRQHSAGAVISRPEERHVLLCLDLLCSVFFHALHATKDETSVSYATGVSRLRNSMVHT